jgi:hypothetical protein
MARSGDHRDGQERRRQARSSSLCSGTVHHDGVTAIDCVIRDLSPSGARVTLQWAIAGQNHCILDIDGIGLFPARIAWRRGNEAGLQFLVDPAASHCEAAARRGERPG